MADLTQKKEEVTEAIILAGGFGTRLKETVPDLPKSLASVAGRAMLSYIIDDLRLQGVRRFIFSLGYKAEQVIQYLEDEYPTLDHEVVIEDEPLGTGGAVLLAIQKTKTGSVLVVNGDTLFKINIHALGDIFNQYKADCVIALKPLKNFDRYGAVEIDNNRIIAFREKQFMTEGYINGGIYLLDKEAFLQRDLPMKFSFEKEYLEKFAPEGNFYGSVQDGYFVDIGVPEDYHRAGEDLKSSPRDLSSIDKSWSVFLDRDGVINKEIVGRYVLNTGEFHFLEGVPEAIADLRNIFGKVFVVSNQRGIGRGLMTEQDLGDIHNEMQKVIASKGGSIDRIYHCPEVDNSCFDRKPNPGMALKAARDFPSIRLDKSVMVGNKPSDMRFGRSAGMVTVFITTTNPDQPFPHPDIDHRFSSLAEFVKALKH